MKEDTHIHPDSIPTKVSVFDMIADAMEQYPITEEDWTKIQDATRDRLLHSYPEGEDTPSNRVFVHMDISNALFDIRDARNRAREASKIL